VRTRTCAPVTRSRIGEDVLYIALPPRAWEIVGPDDAVLGVLAASHRLVVVSDPVAVVVRTSWPLFVTRVPVADGLRVPVLTREAVIASLLSRGGLAIGLAGILMRGTGAASLNADEVREILKAARQPERFQPMLELLDVA